VGNLVPPGRSRRERVPPALRLVHLPNRKVDIRLHGKGNSELPWRKAGQPSHVVDVVDSDQYVVNKEVFLYTCPGKAVHLKLSSGFT